jgi:hypothetical protein
MEAAYLRNGNDFAAIQWFDLAWIGCVAFQRRVAARLVVIDQVVRENALEMGSIQDDDMVKTLAAKGADQALDIGVLPGRVRRGEDFFDAQVAQATLELVAVDAVPVADHVARGFVEGEGFAHLPADPCGRWVRGDVEVNDAAAVVAEDNKDVEHLKSDRRHDAEINGGQGSGVIREEGSPSRRRRLRGAGHVFGDRGFREVVAEQSEFGLDARRSPEGVRARHPFDKADHSTVDRWPARLTS